MAYRIYGLTHDENDQPIVRTPRSVKVGIGIPKGKDIYAYMDDDGKYCISIPGDGGRQVWRSESIEEAREKYREMYGKVPERRFPSKLPHFIFTKLAGNGAFVPDWEAIRDHGPKPTEIDIIFLTDDPFDATLQMWAKTGLQCSGDGRDAQRILSLARTPEEKRLAKEAAAEGRTTFPILQGCRNYGCEYAQGDAPLCKPHGLLRFQLVSRPTLGGSAQYDTTSFRSIANLASCLEQIKQFTQGRVAGIPLKMILRPHTVTVKGRDGKPATSIAYNVSVEFRTEQAEQLKQALIESANRWAVSGGTEIPKALPSAMKSLPEPELPPEDGEDFGGYETEAQQAEALTAEFYAVEDTEDVGDPTEGIPGDEFPAEDGDDFGGPTAPTVDDQVEQRTEDKVGGLLAQLEAAQKAKEAAKAALEEAAEDAEATPSQDDPPFEISQSDAPPVEEAPKVAEVKSAPAKPAAVKPLFGQPVKKNGATSAKKGWD